MDIITYALLKKKINTTTTAPYDDTELQNKIAEIKNDFITLIGNAPENMDTLEEISNWIDEHEDVKVPEKLSELESDEEHRTVTDDEKQKWDSMASHMWEDVT